MNANSWATRKLGDPEVASLVMGQSPPSSAYNTNRSGLPFYQGKADFGPVYPKPRVWCTEPQRVAEKYDVLISVRAPVGDANIAVERSCLGRGVSALRPAKGTNFAFLFFAMQESKDRLASLGSGTTFQSINKNTLEDFEIPYPSKPEQAKIAAVLWMVQKAVEVQDKLVRTTRELKAAAMQSLFNRGLCNEPLKETEIGPVPESWEIVPVSSHFRAVAGGTPSRSNPAYWIGGTIPWVKTGEVDYVVISDTEEKITAAALKDSAAKMIPSGAVLVAMYGQGVTRGKVAMLGIEATTNQACVALLPHTNEVRPDFLYAYLTFSYERLRSLAHGGQQQNLNAELIKSFSLPKPGEDEQREISRILQTLDRKIALHEKKRAALQDLFQTLLHQLMTARIRVHELDIDTSEVAG